MFTTGHLWTQPELTESSTQLSQYFFVKAKVKVKVKLSLCLTKQQAIKAYWGRGVIAPLIL
jgi:hypothetical protein